MKKLSSICVALILALGLNASAQNSVGNYDSTSLPHAPTITQNGITVQLVPPPPPRPQSCVVICTQYYSSGGGAPAPNSPACLGTGVNCY